VTESVRHQVFVSSTFLDLKEERAAVVSALLQMEAFPAGMELFPAADENAWTLITEVIDDSDYYLLVIGGRYGSIDPQTELSFTEKEYDYAIEAGKPVMAFLHADPDEIPLGKSEKEDATRKKLEAFRAKVEADKHVKYWSNADELAAQVTLSFASLRKRHPAVGWIRGDAGASPETLAELNDLRKQLAEADAQRSEAQKGPPPGAGDLVQGQEKTKFSFGYSAEITMAGQYEFESTTFSGLIEAEISWDDLFSWVAPDLLHEASEKTMRTRFNTLLTEELAGDAAEAAWQLAEEKGTPSKERGAKVFIRSEDFGTVVVQFRALGLIEKSDRPRSVKDTATYWTLTPFGDEHLTQLRALRRPEL